MSVIVGTGAFTPFGLNALQTAFLLRTGMPAMTWSPLADQQGEPVTFGLQGTLDPEKTGGARALDLALPAFDEAVAPLLPFADRLRIGVVLSLDEELAPKSSWSGPNPGGELLAAFERHVLSRFPHSKVTVVARGAGGPGQVLPDALAALSRFEIDALIFGGAHTDYDPARIRWLEDQGRLFTVSNLDAIVPGECAAFVALMAPDVARRANLPVLGRVGSIASGFEEATPDNDLSAYEAKGLTAAVRAATRAFVGEKRTAGWMLTDSTFEMRRLYEWQSVITRTREVWGEPFVVEAPAQRMGLLAAAALPLLMVTAAEGFSRNFAPSPLAVLMTGSDGGERTALVMEAV